MTIALSARVTLTVDEMLAVATRLGLQGFPTVLAVRPRHDTVDRLHAALDRATETLSGRGLITDGCVDDDLSGMLSALQRPDRELAMRLVTPDGIARVCVVRRTTMLVLARRIGADIALSALDSTGALRGAIDALRAELPLSEPAPIEPIGAPLDAMAETLDEARDSAAMADRIRTLGAEPRAAMLLGTALTTRQAFAEIVYHALVEGEGRITRTTAAVGVFYTRRGRIVAAPSVSPTGQMWTTLKPGSDHALTQAIGQLVELSTQRWEDS